MVKHYMYAYAYMEKMLYQPTKHVFSTCIARPVPPLAGWQASFVRIIAAPRGRMCDRCLKQNVPEVIKDSLWCATRECIAGECGGDVKQINIIVLSWVPGQRHRTLA